MPETASKHELSTPALCLNADAFERNLLRMQRAVRAADLELRPHAKAHKCPEIAKRQLAIGANGICAAKVSEAEVMFDHGIDRILLTTPNVTQSKIRRAMRLVAQSGSVIQTVDNADNARDLSAAAQEAGLTADVLVDVDPGRHRTGIAPGMPAFTLARLVDHLPGLRLRGVQFYDGLAQHLHGFAARRARTLAGTETLLDTLRLLRAGGLCTDIVTGGGTGTYDIVQEVRCFTEIQCGSYIFMDAQYLAIGGRDGCTEFRDFEPSLTVLATIISANFAGMATADAGVKALTEAQPDPIVIEARGAAYRVLSDEFGMIQFDESSRTARLGDRLELIVPHCDPVVNLYDWIYVIRADQVEAIWSIAARGKSQ